MLYVICGHGAGDPGSEGNGYKEANVTRQVGQKLKELGGKNVALLDTSINWYKSGRVNSDLKKQVGNNPVIELHLDAGSPSAKGGHVIIKAGTNPDSYDNKLVSLCKSFFPGRSEVLVKRSDLANVNRAYNCGINYRLIEICFITNAADIKKLQNDLTDYCKKLLACFGIGTAGWVKDSIGWWYRYADGSYPKNKWLKLDAWYYFNSEGYALQNSWRKINGYWYYFDDNCRMKTGWIKLKNLWYYLNTTADKDFPEGAARTGWLKYKGFWYYLNKAGQGTECAMRTGWLDDKGKWYYLQPTKGGIMAENETLTIDGKKYTFDKSGAMV